MSRILLGVTGSIAAYRAPDALKALVADGHEVQALLTHSAARFTTAKTLETFSGKKVLSNDSFAAEHEGTDHIKYARWADFFVVYGTTANFIAKLANGFCDDFLSLQIMATKAPVLLVPAMNVEMWENPANQANVSLLKKRGYVFVGPIEGVLACGEKGLGHVANIEDLVATVRNLNQKKTSSFFSSKKVLLSLGSMKSDIDDVRFIQNKSSGLMGLELARVLKNNGSNVHILAGIVSPQVESELEAFSSTRFQSYEDYTNSLKNLWPHYDVFYSLAAVLDFEVLKTNGKIERGVDQLNLELKPTEDMVAWAVAHKKAGQRVIAFSLESASSWQECIQRAQKKLLKKGADYIVVNRAGLSDQGPDSRQNAFYVLAPDGQSYELALSDKPELAKALVLQLEKLYAPKAIGLASVAFELNQ